MKVGALTLLLCVLCVGHFANGLDSSERLALAEILQNYPDLAHTTRSATLYDYNIARGSAWTGDSMNCAPGASSWAYHGIHCNTNGNVDAVQFTPFWGSGISNKTFHQLAGLSYLKSYASFAPDNFMADAVLVSIPLESFSSKNQVAIDNIVNRTSLKSLSLGVFDGDLISFTDLIHLEHLSLSLPSEIDNFIMRKNLTGVGNFTNLRSLEFGLAYGIASSELPALDDLPSLTDLSISLYVNSEVIFSSSSLQRLSSFSGSAVFNFTNLTNLQSLSILQSLTYGNSDVLEWPSSNLTSLRIYHPVTTMPPFPSSLEQLELASYPLVSFPGFVTTPVPSLRHLGLLGALPRIITSFDFSLLPDVTSLVLSSGQGNLDATFKTVCNLTKLTHLDLSVTGVTTVPECLRDFNLTTVVFGNLFNETSILNFPTTLKSLAAGTSKFANPVPWDDFSYRYPHLENLLIGRGTVGHAFPAQALMRLSNLSSIHFAGAPGAWNGSLPENFFATLTKLENFEVQYSQLTGTFPWYGLENLVTLRVVGCQFDHWPSLIGSAPKLELIDFSLNLLVEIPDDNSFSRMTSLIRFTLYSVPTLNGTQLPYFWANHPTIQEIEISRCLMTGPMPPVISSHFLTTLRLDGNQICGSLPLFQNADMIYLYLNQNQLSGTIPAANWFEQLTITSEINLGNNYLEGTLLDPFLTPASLNLLNLLDVSYNYLHGSIPLISTPNALFNGEDNNFDICSGVDFPRFPVCSLMNMDVCACQEMVNTTCFVSGCPFTGSAKVLPTLPYCPLPPITPVVSCPGNVEGFVCVNGQWVSNHTINTPTLTVPPGAGIIVVNGSLNVPGTLTFSGSGTTIVVNGCSKIGQVEIVLETTPDKTSKTPLVLIVQNDGCPTSLADVPIKVTSPKSCKRTRAETESSTRSSLSVVFVVDSSPCNTKWIILGSVLGGVILLAAIVLAVISVRKYELRKLL